MKRFKYPRTPHLPWSPGWTHDDIRASSAGVFGGKEVVVTEKLDGENTTMYCDHIHARSIDSRNHSSRNWVKRLHAQIQYQIPEGWRLCGENVYAKHSIHYDSLSTYFYVFSIWDSNNTCLSWSETMEWCDLLGLVTPKVFYKGVWDEDLVKSIQVDTNECEGYVVRLVDAFPYREFGSSVAKWVRTNHVKTDQHWMHGDVVPNKLAGSHESCVNSNEDTYEESDNE
ncbi:RNA ligase family protein [Teredinibacter sp. KSP-S5-2]|uniref:RNA ligase family protein n=1 Tax=Teredinibacter sp. KSP-S5-2 TaxID=3034506 RepID=UPI00293433F5|nr:RNA ligase family protein [Teredinibacter sp. KSP-S5-2]WNO10849.1 RNA ligase family protein [Teredinibacter sp. KSP-S5-2]